MTAGQKAALLLANALLAVTAVVLGSAANVNDQVIAESLLLLVAAGLAAVFLMEARGIAALATVSLLGTFGVSTVALAVTFTPVPWTNIVCGVLVAMLSLKMTVERLRRS